MFDPATGGVQSFARAMPSLVDLKVDADGLLYYLAIGAGSIGRIRASSNQAPSILAHPSNRVVAVGQTASFSVSASGSQPLTYQWQRGVTDISGASGSSYSLVAGSADNGATFRVRVSNSFGSVTSSSATLSVTTNAAPVATISAPASGALYSAGDTVTYSGTGSDAEDGALPPSAFTWEVVFHHATHTHPFMAATSGASSGSFTIPRLGELATDVFYRIHLTVRDSAGLTHTTTRDSSPRVSTLSLRTSPAGLQLTLDGTPVTTPADVQSVVGMTRQLGVVSPQTSGNTKYVSTHVRRGAALNDRHARHEHDVYGPTRLDLDEQPGLSDQYFDNTTYEPEAHVCRSDARILL